MRGKTSIRVAALLRPTVVPGLVDYLGRIDATKILNEAVNQLGSEQPSVPYGWLAAHLQSISKARGGR